MNNIYEPIRECAEEIKHGNTKFKNIAPFRQPMVYLILENRLDEEALLEIIEGSQLEETHKGNPPLSEDALKQATAYELARLFIELDGAAEEYDFKKEYWKLIRGVATGGIYNRIKPLISEGIGDIKASQLAGAIYKDEGFIEDLGEELNDELAKINSDVVQNWREGSSERVEFERPDELSMVVFFIKQVRFFLNQEDLLDSTQ